MPAAPPVTVIHVEFAPRTAVHAPFAVTAICRPVAAPYPRFVLLGRIVSAATGAPACTTVTTAGLPAAPAAVTVTVPVRAEVSVLAE